MPSQPLFQVDAFATSAFSGNPAAVCLLDEPAERDWMQAVAAEMNLSETAFVHAHDEDWDLRWFTPSVEVELCGHATLAAAHVLWEEVRRVDASRPVRFHTLSGELTATRSERGVTIELPADPVTPFDDGGRLAAALGVRPTRVGRGRLYELVEVASEEEVRGARPDFEALSGIRSGCAVLTSRAEAGELDFVSRFFAPAKGVDEDPVTGSAHCLLAPWWSERLGRRRLEAAQVSRRGGRLGVELEGDRVRLTGRAVTVLRGELCG